ncbi:MAG: AgmX/PglI C-terminal domain-containing protein [Myxococcales bacterium]|nr:MAG: AgmX/PglI C-terminal domain-containing protein [Myxococcales bacterium]
MRTVLGLAVILLSTACPPREAAESAATAPPGSSQPLEEPAPLPPEETPPLPEEPQRPDASDAKPIEPGITATGAPTRGKLPKAAIDETLQQAQPGIAACYERALKAKPGLRGVVNVAFVVSTDGKVVHTEAAAGDDALPDEAAVRCILVEIEKLVFPPPTGGRVFINYPLTLAPPKP